MFKLLRKRLLKTGKGRGFTLTELVVVVALVALLMACVTAFAQPIRKMLQGSTAKSDALTINEIISTFIERKMSYAHYVTVFSGRNYDLSDVTLSTEYNKIRTKYYSDIKDAERKYYSPGMLVLRFDHEEDADPLKKTFKVYDINIKDYASLPVLSNDNLAFKTDFYGGYEYLMTCEDTSVQLNNQKKRAYLNLKIQTFDFRSDFTEGLNSKLIMDYYENQVATPSKPDFIKESAYINERTGVEDISFSLENIRVKTTSTLNNNGTTDPDDDYYTVESVPDNGSGSFFTIKRGNDAGSYGTDVIIMYDVQTYKIGL